jgi:hypothetical protein
MGTIYPTEDSQILDKYECVCVCNVSFIAAVIYTEKCTKLAKYNNKDLQFVMMLLFNWW